MEALSPNSSLKIKKEQIDVKRLKGKKPRGQKSKTDENSIFNDNIGVENTFPPNISLTTDQSSSYACSSPSPVRSKCNSNNSKKISVHQPFNEIDNTKSRPNSIAPNVSLVEPSCSFSSSYPSSAPSPISKVKTINQLILLADQVKCFKTDLCKFNNGNYINLYINRYILIIYYRQGRIN